MARTLRLDQARRLALAAQGLDRPRPTGRIDVRHLRNVLRHVKVVQIDSVNVLARSHYLPLFSRLGPYPTDLLDEAAYTRRELFEYWAHEASYVPVSHHRLMRPRMARWLDGPRQRRFRQDHPGYLERVESEIAERGPLTVAELTDPGKSAGPWWGWSKGKLACEWLFAGGRLAVATRRRFVRVYDLAERVLPAAALDGPTPDRDEAERELLLEAAHAHGVGTVDDLADYYRLPVRRARTILADLVRAGELEEVEVDGWGEPAYLHPETRLPRRVQAAALLSPFDPLVWFRDRAERLFGFRYRIEIYVPAAKRVHGYYVLPFLLGDQLVARVDLKADRPARTLLVRAAWREDGDACAPALARELVDMAAWLELDEIVVEPRGDLAPALSRALP